jgi:hypothetical protein
MLHVEGTRGAFLRDTFLRNSRYVLVVRRLLVTDRKSADTVVNVYSGAVGARTPHPAIHNATTRAASQEPLKIIRHSRCSAMGTKLDGFDLQQEKI